MEKYTVFTGRVNSLEQNVRGIGLSYIKVYYKAIVIKTAY